ncbi:GNAT family N-acetyltransferase [Methylibium petroleiphilum]|uniref:Putative phosphinothricin acetyltransferase n=1 Tax=Methylibium petroleiphilum (strain ATCC BAA-1232 / LMG 22953 / PM1) TaxID=420662 RepID=A2SES5_METPP|nr:GNAT family N-acetyltransferase [Methylibium petroleiphilum]ABM94064.1 putative phosphinothricin acetyltransferase [Methylibium petroleiphilum PM1]
MSATYPAAALLLRPSAAADLPALTALYGWHARHGSGTFELEGPSLEEMARRRDDVLAKGLPWLVAERHGDLLGYAYAAPFRPRLAYRFALEDSIYLAPHAHRQGVGRALLAELIARCEAWGARQMFAVIGDSTNAASIGLHRALGFADVGTMHAAGWKFDRWLDVVIMQRRLGDGDATPPSDCPPAGGRS